MAYFISCSGAKTCLNRVETFPSSLENIKSFPDLHEARLELMSLLGLNLDWKNTLLAYKLYSGKLYSQVSIENWESSNTDVKIVSALFGIINHTELLPDYNVMITDKIPNTNLLISDFWRSKNIARFVNIDSDVDLLFSKYRKAFNVKGEAIGIQPSVIWNDKYGSHKGKWLNQQLNSL
jgi:cytoplasmic iron level regulating protein YaaA (DUF328/UPF0246 family)